MQPFPVAEKNRDLVQAWRSTLAHRDVHIWGAGQQGRGLCSVLQREGIHVTGYIDRSRELQGTQLMGLPVRAPEEVLDWAPKEHAPFVFAAAFFHDAEIVEQCQAAGLRLNEDVVSYKEVKPFDYAIDVSGACNLRCLACPRASRHERHPPKGFMKVETFGRVLDKILSEDPLVGSVQLYQWGEPLLHPQLPEIIRLANDRGVRTAVSSNMNLTGDLEPIIAAKPTWFRVSVSGTERDYEKVHAGANWDRLRENLKRLGHLRATLHPEMKAEVYYHIYQHNRGAPLEYMRAFCQQWNFEFHPVWAYLISLDDVLERLEGGALSEPARQAEQMLAISLDEGMALARRENEKPCPVKRCILVNWDCSVSHCMMFFYPKDNVASRNFLETSLPELVATRDQCDLCARCTAQSLHRYCAVYATNTVPLTNGVS